MPSITDIFRQYGGDYLKRFARNILQSHRKAIEAILACRTSEMDGCVMGCPACGEECFHPFSCGNRACPNCHEAKRYRWLEKRRAELLPGVTYFHVVFTIPAQYREFARSHQKEFLPLLFSAAVDSLNTLAADPKHLGGRIGMLSVLHTWTRTLQYHPHVHMLIPGIALLPDRSFKVKDSFLVPIGPLRTLFRAKFITKLKHTFPGATLPYIDPKKKWNVYIKESSSNPDRVLNYFARYIYGQAIDNSRIVSLNNDQVTFSYKRDQVRRTMTLPAFEFLRLYLQHTLPKRFHRVRAYGLWHSAYRHITSEFRLLLYNRSGQPAPAPPKPRPHCVPCPRCATPMIITRNFVTYSTFIRLSRPP